MCLGRGECYIWTVWSLAKVGASQADNDNNNAPENFHKNYFLAKIFDWSIL